MGTWSTALVTAEAAMRATRAAPARMMTAGLSSVLAQAACGDGGRETGVRGEWGRAGGAADAPGVPRLQR